MDEKEYMERLPVLKSAADACLECLTTCGEFDGIMPDCNQCALKSVKNCLESIRPADVVSREKYDKLLADYNDLKRLLDTYGGEYGIAKAFEAKRMLDEGEARPVVRGKWIPKNADGSWRVDTCSICKADTHYVRYAPAYDHCPNCGARNVEKVKVGDKVLDKIADHIFTIQTVELGHKAGTLFRCGNPGTDDYVAFYDFEIGERFDILDHKEAEAALKGEKDDE